MTNCHSCAVHVRFVFTNTIAKRHIHVARFAILRTHHISIFIHTPKNHQIRQRTSVLHFTPIYYNYSQYHTCCIWPYISADTCIHDCLPVTLQINAHHFNTTLDNDHEVTILGYVISLILVKLVSVTFTCAAWSLLVLALRNWFLRSSVSCCAARLASSSSSSHRCLSACHFLFLSENV